MFFHTTIFLTDNLKFLLKIPLKKPIMAKSGSNHASAIIEAKETFATLQELSNLLNTGKGGCSYY
jgi:hypothetical protein